MLSVFISALVGGDIKITFKIKGDHGNTKPLYLLCTTVLSLQSTQESFAETFMSS